MSTKRSTLVPSVAYLRRSTDRQEASIPDQRKAVQQYADEKGYRIDRWYIDDAISGDDTDRRAEFQRMIADAQVPGDFRAILCWDQSRFGRFSPQEAGYWTYPLAKAGIQLVTVDKGPIDWAEFTEWLMYAVNQHGKHQFLVDLSKDVTRGQLEAANKGSWIGSAPYAYRIEGERKNKRLVVDDEGKVRIVQRIFREFVEEGRAMKNIADRLNDEGVVSPGGRAKGWRFDSVKVILENPAYTGDYIASRWAYGKYHRIKEGRVSKASGGRHRNPKAEWIVHLNNHEAIIDRLTFDKAQEILAKGKGRAPHTPETNPYVLSCVLRCGRCGSVLRGDTHKKRRYYECGNFQYNGTEACPGTTVREDRILQEIADHLETRLGLEGLEGAAYYGHLTDGDLPNLPGAFEVVRRLVLPPPKPKAHRTRLEKRAAQLKGLVDKARRNLILLDPENIQDAQAKIKEMEDERLGIERELAESKPPAEKDVNAIVLGVLSDLYNLAACCRILGRQDDPGWDYYGSLERVAPQKVRRFVRSVSGITVHTRIEGEKTRKRHVFERGEIALSPVGVVTRDSNLPRNSPYSGPIVIRFGRWDQEDLNLHPQA